MQVKIAEMTPADCDEVLSLWRRTEGVGLNEGDTREGITRYLGRNPGLSHVARPDARIVAAVLCGHDGRRGYLHHLAVEPEFRGQGLGSAIVETCLARLASVGIEKCNLFVYTDNEQGARFWIRNGWTERTDLKVLSTLTANRPSHDRSP